LKVRSWDDNFSAWWDTKFTTQLHVPRTGVCAWMFAETSARPLGRVGPWQVPDVGLNSAEVSPWIGPVMRVLGSYPDGARGIETIHTTVKNP
jgi:hypothetical protein